MAELLRHRQTKEAETDMFYLKPPRHISTLPKKPPPTSRHYQSSAAWLRRVPQEWNFETDVVEGNLQFYIDEARSMKPLASA